MGQNRCHATCQSKCFERAFAGQDLESWGAWSFVGMCAVLCHATKSGETEFYTPPVLGGAALLPFSAPAVYKNPVP